MTSKSILAIGSVFLFLLLLAGSVSPRLSAAASLEEQQVHRFPQDKVDAAIASHRFNRNRGSGVSGVMFDDRNSGPSRGFKDLSAEDRIVSSNAEDIYYIGPGADTLFVDSDLELEADVIVCGLGVLLVDHAKFTLSGHLDQYGDSKVILRNGACLYVPQLFNSHYLHRLQDRALFEAIDSTVDGKCVYQIRQYDDSRYVARQTVFPHWNFRKIWDNSTLILEDANMVGDMTINDSCDITFTRCDTILPWLGAAAGDVFDYSFPPWEYVGNYTFDSNLDGIDGVDYSVSFEACRGVMWGVESWPGSSIEIDSSFIDIAVRIYEDAEFVDIHDFEHYETKTFPLDDRLCKITNSYLHMWFPYVYDTAVVHIDDCSYAESKTHDYSELIVTNTTSDGFPSTTSPVDNGFIFFSDGLCRTFASTWNHGTLLLVNTRIEPRSGHEERQNIAHGQSTFLAVNCVFEPDYQPYARDAAMVMFAAMDTLENAAVGTEIDIVGSAWTDTGPFNPIEYERYQLCWSPLDADEWSLIAESANSVFFDSLGRWNTGGAEAGPCELRLTIWNSANDSLIAYQDITLLDATDVGDGEVPRQDFVLAQNYPNPFNPQTTIRYELPEPMSIGLTIHDLSGRLVRTLVRDRMAAAGVGEIVWDGCDELGRSLPSGTYFYSIISEDYSETCRMSLVR